MNPTSIHVRAMSADPSPPDVDHMFEAQFTYYVDCSVCGPLMLVAGDEIDDAVRAHFADHGIETPPL